MGQIRRRSYGRFGRVSDEALGTIYTAGRRPKSHSSNLGPKRPARPAPMAQPSSKRARTGPADFDCMLVGERKAGSPDTKPLALLCLPGGATRPVAGAHNLGQRLRASELTCPVCLAESHEARAWHVARCGHALCRPCLRKLRAAGSPGRPLPCPTCRAPLAKPRVRKPKAGAAAGAASASSSVSVSVSVSMPVRMMNDAFDFDDSDSD